MHGWCTECGRAVCERHGANREPVVCNECHNRRWEARQERIKTENAGIQAKWDQARVLWDTAISEAVSRCQARGDHGAPFRYRSDPRADSPHHGWPVEVNGEYYGIGTNYRFGEYYPLYKLTRHVSSRLLRQDEITWLFDSYTSLPQSPRDKSHSGDEYGAGATHVLTLDEVKALIRAVKQM
jgi:hypothetical protein